MQLAVPERRDTPEQAIACRVIARCEALRVFRRLEPRLERIDLAEDARGSFPLDVGGLGDEGQGEKERSHWTIPKRLFWAVIFMK